ncbi:TPA: ATP-binding protein [Stenotrophomonas maltophilia]
MAASRSQHLLQIGSPGCRKSVQASRVPSLLPDADDV